MQPCGTSDPVREISSGLSSLSTAVSAPIVNKVDKLMGQILTLITSDEVEPLRELAVQLQKSGFTSSAAKVEQLAMIALNIDDETKRILDQWAREGAPDEERAKAKRCIIEYLSNKDQTSLYLNDLKLRTLPAVFGIPTLSTKLICLSLAKNRLTELPAEIGQLSVLEILDLSNNKLTELPVEIGQLSALNELWLTSNQLTVLPPEITRLRALQSLYLSINQLTTVPPEITQLRALQVLVLSFNQLTTVPPEITQLRALESLDLSSNKLTALPAEIGQLENLNYLDLTNNCLTTLPAEIRQLRKLNTIVDPKV
jgi:Leucine rich repeat